VDLGLLLGRGTQALPMPFGDWLEPDDAALDRLLRT
jgi:hypothetical protein